MNFLGKVFLTTLSPRALRPPAWRRLTSSRERRRKMGEMEENEEDKPEKDMVVGE